MKRIALGMLVALCALALVTPAHAIVAKGVDYTFLAKRTILMEQGPTVINGNIGVSDPDGRLQIGSHNTIKGTTTANNTIFGSFSLTSLCQYNVKSGAAPSATFPICLATVTPLPAGLLPLVPNWPPGPLGAVPVDNCVNTAQNVTIATSGPLAPGCYRDVRVNAGVIVTLSAGTYTMRNFRMINGSKLLGAGQTINVQSLPITEPNVTIENVTIITPATAGDVHFFNDNRLTNVTIYAPNTTVHLHTGTIGKNIQVIGEDIIIEPILVEKVEEGCGCFEDVDRVGGTVKITQGDNLTAVQNYFLAKTCDITGCSSATCFQVTPLPPNNSDTEVTLNIANVTSGTYRVIGQWKNGTFCSAETVIVP